MIKKILCMILAVLMLIPLASCSFFEEEGSGRFIDHIDPTVEGGKFYFAVYYTDSNVPELVEAPQPTGLKSIYPDPNNKDNTKTVLIFEYDDGTKVSHEIPNGKDGLDGSVMWDVKKETGLDGVDYLVFYINGKDGVQKLKEIPFSEFKGEDGKDGIGFDPEFNVDGAFVTGKDDIGYYFEYKMDGFEVKRIYVYYKRDISLAYDEKTGRYTITVKFNDGDEVVEFSETIQRPNTWLSDDDRPKDEAGIVGDFFFDTKHKIIWQKVIKPEGDIDWIVIADLVTISQEATLTVTFDANGGYIENKAADDNGFYQYPVNYGTYFTDNGEDRIPIPKRDGYTFAGWYKEREIDEAVDVKFNDFIQITSNITLIAHWVENKA